jgi:aminoglycoside phosphotransferase (APT) family kinase protein
MKTKLQKVLSSFVPGLELIHFEPLTGGVSSEVFLIEAKQNKTKIKLVLRYEAGPPSKNDIKNEFNLLQALANTNIPSAEPLFIDTSCKILDKPFMLLSFLEGDINIPNTDNLDLITKMADQLRSIHSINPALLPDLPIQIDPIEGLLKYLPKGDEWMEIRNYLSSLKNTAFEGQRVFLHGDFWPGNILWAKDQIVAVIDWDYAAIGDPISDLAVSSLEMRYEFGKEGMNQLCEAYLKHSMIDNSRFSLWLISIASSTLHFINQWNLSEAKKNLIKTEALLTIQEESQSLLNSKD